MEPSGRSRAFLSTATVVLVVLCVVVVTDTTLMPHRLAKKLFSVYLISANLLSFYKSTMRDPGRLSCSITQCFDIRPLYLKGNIQVVSDPLNGTRRIVFPDRDTIYVQKYCLSCNLFRPSGTSHCSECGFCVLERDHHCVWLDNCIGRNNIKHFFCFIISLALLSYHAMDSLKTLYGSCEKHIPYYCYFVAALLLGTVAVCVVLLVVYNVFLALLGITSKEFLRANWNSLPKPSLRGAVKRLCTIRPYIITVQESI